MRRLREPPAVDHHTLLPVAVAGLLVNLVGLALFQEHYVGSGDNASCCTHATCAHDGGDNMRGVFLHVLADAMGSVGAIVSSLLIRYFRWWRADPICSLVVAALILASVIPLLRSSAAQLRAGPKTKPASTKS